MKYFKKISTVVLILALIGVYQLYTPRASAAFGFVQGTSVIGKTPTFSSNVSVGNLIFVVVSDSSGGTTATTAVTDSKGNTYTLLDQIGGNDSQTTFYAVVRVGGASDQVTVTSTAGNVTTTIQEYNGFIGTPTVDKHTLVKSFSNTTPSCTTAATTYADELVIGGITSGSLTNAITLGSGYTNLNTIQTTSTQGGEESKVVAVTGNQTVTDSSTHVNWTCSASTFYDDTTNVPIPTMIINGALQLAGAMQI